ncbi:integrase catalytic domain-containing protein [Nephila pilipes]|uniref:Integrase catalytic domain-containing protein n=1 Tax=Nephila pilipes TaxID=299642 RepID=A0A8X6ILE6_NEPPI|nr:integrase catalytic domain-containing protein [Nephila pilipes]
MELNDLYIECNRRLQALNALGENTEAYGRILAPKIIREFPKEISCSWIIFAKREKLVKGNNTRFMRFLAEEVEGSVCSRNRLALIKKVTLPYLKLLAALMGTRLLKYFCEEVDIQPSAATLWIDSKITLSWIRSNHNKWKTFVCNRTMEILQYTSPAQWRYCPGTQNPADHLSRGILPSELSNLKNWWYSLQR